MAAELFAGGMEQWEQSPEAKNVREGHVQNMQTCKNKSNVRVRC